MPCVLDSPFCSYDSYSVEEDSNKSRRESNSHASTSGTPQMPIHPPSEQTTCVSNAQDRSLVSVLHYLFLRVIIEI